MSDPKPIKLLYAGTFTDTQGRQHTYSDADLDRIATSYDYAANPAPLVVGHPKLDAPAFGWAKSVAVEGGHLVAYPDPDKLQPAFAEAVNAGRFPKVSASLYAPDDPSNPAPGGWTLKHIGFLGGAAPAVKGLGMVSFAESEGIITLETPTAQEPPKVDTNDRTAEFAERETMIAAKEAELGTKETELAARAAEFAETQRTARHEGNVAFAEILVTGGKLAPAGKDLVVGILDSLGTEADANVSFGEANKDLAPASAFRKLLEGAGTIVDFSERAPADRHGGDGKEDPNAIAREAASFMESEKAGGRIITHAAAVRHVMKDQAV